MALKKNITLENGCTAGYHKIAHVSLMLDRGETVANVSVSSYLDEHYRELEKPIKNSHFTIPFTTEEEEATGIRALMYGKLKALPVWEGSEDC